MLSEPDVKLIAISHSLLKSASENQEVNYLIKAKGYSLLLDETLDLMEPYTGIKHGDLNRLLYTKEIEITDNLGLVVWKKEVDSANGAASETDKFKVQCIKKKNSYRYENRRCFYVFKHNFYSR